MVDESVNMTPTGTINLNNTDEIIRYQPDENGRYINDYVNILQL